MGGIRGGGNWGGGTLGGHEFGRYNQSDTPLDVAEDLAKFLNYKGYVSVAGNRMDFIRENGKWGRYLDEFLCDTDGTLVVFRDGAGQVATTILKLGKWRSESVSEEDVDFGDGWRVVLARTYSSYVSLCTGQGNSPVEFESYLQGWLEVGLFALRDWREHLPIYPSVKVARDADNEVTKAIEELRAQGIEQGDSLNWLKAGFSVAEISDWHEVWKEEKERFGFGEFLGIANDWSNGGFCPGEFKEWSSLTAVPETAAEFVGAGLESKDVRLWRESGFYFPEIVKKWMELGFDALRAAEVIESVMDKLGTSEQLEFTKNPWTLESNLKALVSSNKGISDRYLLENICRANFKIPEGNPIGALAYRGVMHRIGLLWGKDVQKYTDRAIMWILSNWPTYGAQFEIPMVQACLGEAVRRHRWRTFPH